MHKKMNMDTNEPGSYNVLADEEDWIKIATYNVLYPAHNKLWRWFMDHNTRFNYQFDHLFPDIDADILMLNEVTTEYIEIMKTK